MFWEKRRKTRFDTIKNTKYMDVRKIENEPGEKTEFVGTPTSNVENSKMYKKSCFYFYHVENLRN